MAKRLSAEEISQLNEVQLEAYGRDVLDSMRERRALLKLAKGTAPSLKSMITIGVLLSGVGILFPPFFREPISFFLLAVGLIRAFHMHTNRRIDAIVRLLDLDQATHHLPEGACESSSCSVLPDSDSSSPVRSAEEL